MSKREDSCMSEQVFGSAYTASTHCLCAALASRCTCGFVPFPRSAQYTALSSSLPAVVHCLCLSAACFASPIHLLHASLILINMWISATQGWGEWAGGSSSSYAATTELPGPCSRARWPLLAPTWLPAHQPCLTALPGPCCSPCDKVLLRSRHLRLWRGESRQPWSAGETGRGTMGLWDCSQSSILPVKPTTAP